MEGISHIFNISMPWLLEFMEQTFHALPEDLNTTIIAKNNEFEVLTLEADELWSFIGGKENDQLLWLVMHSTTRQISAVHVDKRTKASREALMAKLSAELKKAQFFLQIKLLLTTKLSHGSNTVLPEKKQERQATLKDLIVRSDSDAQDLSTRLYRFLKK